MDTASIVAIICAIISACVGPLSAILLNHVIAKRDKREQEKELKAEKEKEAWQKEVKGLIAPVATEVSQIKTHQETLDTRLAHVEAMLEEDRKATILNLRCDMKTIVDAHKAGKDLDNGDKTTYRELFKRYHHMGGNHYRDTVDDWSKTLGFTTEEIQYMKDHDDEE